MSRIKHIVYVINLHKSNSCLARIFVFYYITNVGLKALMKQFEDSNKIYSHLFIIIINGKLLGTSESLVLCAVAFAITKQNSGGVHTNNSKKTYTVVFELIDPGYTNK